MNIDIKLNPNDIMKEAYKLYTITHDIYRRYEKSVVHNEAIVNLLDDLIPDLNKAISKASHDDEPTIKKMQYILFIELVFFIEAIVMTYKEKFYDNEIFDIDGDRAELVKARFGDQVKFNEAIVKERNNLSDAEMAILLNICNQIEAILAV